VGVRPTLGVYRFSSCDGCQLALLDPLETLQELAQQLEILHFPAVGLLAPERAVDIALVDGSVGGEEDLERLLRVRERSRLLITIGACATSGGLQALRGLADEGLWLRELYGGPDHWVDPGSASPISARVRVDLELWGCPVTGRQVLAALRDLRLGAQPRAEPEALCMECQRRQQVCRLVTGAAPCLGPVTRAGCGALCPSFGRACYGCTGPSEVTNHRALALRLAGFGLVPAEIARRFLFIHSSNPACRRGAEELQGRES
jgi:coenzyme F420-reducing hydrogenase gamma subunit